MTTQTVVDFADVASVVGTTLGPSEWIEITQDRIDTFADATDDHQWIHVDPERAKQGPFGAPIAHGFLTLSLLIPMWSELFDVSGVKTKVNYGLEKVRFPAPVMVDSRVRLQVTIAEVTELAPGTYQLIFDPVVEVEGQDKPACAARIVFRFIGETK